MCIFNELQQLASVFYASTKARVCFLFKITALLIFFIEAYMCVTFDLYSRQQVASAG